MKISFDNLRKEIAYDYNNVIDAVNQFEDLPCDAKKVLESLKIELYNLRASIGGLLCCFDENQMPDDFNDLSGEIKLLEL